MLLALWLLAFPVVAAAGSVWWQDVSADAAANSALA